MGKKKLVVLLISFNLALLAVLGGVIYQKQLEIEGHEAERTLIQQEAFSQLAAHMAGIDTALQKCRYATSPELIAALGTEIYGRANLARFNLDKLPFPAEALEGIGVFVTRVGDYARATARGAGGEMGHSEQNVSNLNALAETASHLAGNLNHVLTELSAGERGLEDLLYDLEEIGGSVEVFSERGGPGLVYDGLYSDHLLERRPARLEGMEEVTADEAKGRVSTVFDLKKDIFSYIGSRDGDIPVYRFLARVDGGDFVVEVSKIGGLVLWAGNNRQVRSAPLTKEEGLGVARDFMERNQHKTMELRHWWVEENRVTARFMHVQEGVVCYPDWIELSVALDNGRVAAFDAAGYVMSHRARDLETVSLSMDQALAAIPSQLTVLKDGMAIIYTSGKHEMLCHTFLCKNEAGEKYMVYVNAQTGQQQDIRIVVEDERGFFIF